MKQTTSWYLKLPLKPAFLVYFWYLSKVKFLLILNLFISEYLNKILQWKDMKKAFSVTHETENFCFCLRQKLNENQTAQIRNIVQSLRTFIKLSGPIPEVKEICIDQWLWKYFWILGRIQVKQVVSKLVWFGPNIFRESETQYHFKKFPLCLLSFKLGDSISSC